VLEKDIEIDPDYCRNGIDAAVNHLRPVSAISTNFLSGKERAARYPEEQTRYLPRIKDVLSRVPRLRCLGWRGPFLCGDLLESVARSPIEDLWLSIEEIPKIPTRLDA
jgi:hypothetical protein